MRNLWGQPLFPLISEYYVVKCKHMKRNTYKSTTHNGHKTYDYKCNGYIMSFGNMGIKNIG